MSGITEMPSFALFMNRIPDNDELFFGHVHREDLNRCGQDFGFNPLVTESEMMI